MPVVCPSTTELSMTSFPDVQYPFPFLARMPHGAPSPDLHDMHPRPSTHRVQYGHCAAALW